MIEFLKESAKSIRRFISNRILYLFVLLVVLFYLLFARLFDLQIVLHDSFRPAPPRTREVTMPVAALRGNIFDSKGRPLTSNKLAYTVKIDPSEAIVNESLNEALYKLTLLFEKNGEDYVNDFPMTMTEPYGFTYPDGESRERLEYRWKADMAVENPETATAQEAFDYLRKVFDIDPALPNPDARKILNFRCMLYMERMIYMDEYDPQPVTLAYDVKPQTVAAIEENNALFAGIHIEIQALREYPGSIYFSHMLGYIGRINDVDLENNKDKGYTASDLIGRTGLERSMEGYLRGKFGSETFEVNGAGSKVGTLEYTAPEPGGNVFLTIDADLQKKAYHLLEDYLARELAAKITLRHRTEKAITLKEIFQSLIKSNNLDIEAVMASPEGGDAHFIRAYILERFPDANVIQREDLERIKTILTEGVESGRLTIPSLLLAMTDIGQLTDTGDFTARVKSGAVTAQNAVIEKILSKELSPQMINLDPSTGSVVILDIETNAVRAAVSYPSYDNNRLVNNFDIEYYNKNNAYDPTNPMVNRPFNEPRAPGSTFKMVTAAAVLESGAITENTKIYDEHTFTKTGKPYTDCWSPSSHGSINVAQAIQVSCNYFFCEAAYRLGNAKNDRVAEGVQTLNDYMVYFGLNDKTGVEIGELYDQYEEGELQYRISSPEFKKYVYQSRDAFSPRSEWDWYDGDTVRTAIGQANNNYTPALMAKYISVIANRGTRYPLHLVETVEDYGGNTLMRYQPVPEEQYVTVSEDTWDVIIEGMRLVTEGTGSRNGTAVADFKNFPIRIAGKTGTAQEMVGLRQDHSSFAAFAPLEDPQIAVYVSVPFGDSNALSHVSAQIAREIIGETLGLNHKTEPPEAVNVLKK
ncbi:MAG: hypothetical protein LBR83_08075 [Clostridiales bacterium]|jgi:cell division protein FtsI/penicillin-binding protein 2|nr:hypothetical protein [Clostridiales bacterium]